MRCIRIYDSWASETASLTDAEKGRLIDSLVEFMVIGKENLPNGNERFVYPLMIERIKRESGTHDRTKERRAREREDSNR